MQWVLRTCYLTLTNVACDEWMFNQSFKTFLNLFHDVNKPLQVIPPC